MNMHWLIRMAGWARNPPPMWKVKLVFAVIAACLLLVAVEKMGYWPGALSVNPPIKAKY
jgi:hypothetical protein